MSGTQSLSDHQKTLLFSILDQPSAPFREMHVINRIERELTDSAIPYFKDSFGNIIAGQSSEKALKKRLAISTKQSQPLRLFVAHMDHPGFHGLSWGTPDKNKKIAHSNINESPLLNVKWHGGTPVESLVGSSVWLADGGGWKGTGKITAVELTPSGRSIDSAWIQVSGPADSIYQLQANTLFGGFRFRNTVWENQSILYTKAADDLVGSYAILAVAKKLFGPKKLNKAQKQAQANFLGIFTRAEEVGYIGWLGHLKLGYYKRARAPLLCISLETSRALPGAEIGKGPVIRQGDKTSLFSNGPTHMLRNIALKALPNFHQKRVMDGGTCEATPSRVAGIPTIGISVPLGNYHNQCIEGGPDSGKPLSPAPEFVHLNDIAGLLTLCEAITYSTASAEEWSDPWKNLRKEFDQDLKHYSKLFKYPVSKKKPNKLKLVKEGAKK